MTLERQLGKLLVREHFAPSRPKMAFLVGPRQCGKTTLARRLQEERGTPQLYRNWDDLAWRREMVQAPYGFLDSFKPLTPGRPLAVLDEIHKFPRWKQYVKGLWDTRGSWADILVTGSGRLDIYRRGGDSLLGRYHQYRLAPLTLSEMLKKTFEPETDTPRIILKRLLDHPRPPSPEERKLFQTLGRFGGFPEPLLSANERQHRLWLRERRERLIREDLRDMTRIQMLSSVEHMVELLNLKVGSLLSLNNLREDLGVSMDSVKLWLEQLERLYYCFRIRPFAGKIARALSREPKLYLYDWSELADESVRLENMIAMALLKWCHLTQDWGQEALDLRFVRDKEKREVDFLLTLQGKPFLLIEVKLADHRPSAALHHFAQKLGEVPKILLAAHLEQAGRADNCLVMPAATFLSQIP